MKRQLRTSAGSVALLLLSGFATPCIWAAAENQDSPEVSALLSNAKTDAYQVREDALALESYTRSNTPWEAHSSAINQMKEHVNALGKTDAKLSEAKDKASPWQLVAINRIHPLLKELATNTEGTIKMLNANRNRLSTGDYRDYVEANADVASRLSEMIRDFVDYGRTKDRLDRLGKKLEVPASE